MCLLVLPPPDSQNVSISENYFVVASYFMIYAKPEYKSLTKEIEVLSKKVSTDKEEGAKTKKSAVKKANIQENRLKILNTEMITMKMKSTFLIGLFVVVSLSSLANYFDGIPVARLPFEPFSLIRSITHRGLGGQDYTECSYIFIYMICSYIFRTNIQKFFGLEGPKTSFNPFMPDLGK